MIEIISKILYFCQKYAEILLLLANFIQILVKIDVKNYFENIFLELYLPFHGIRQSDLRLCFLPTVSVTVLFVRP